MKYTVHDVFVIELETEQIVKECINHHEAKKMSNFLNSGGGFNGITPAFFLIPIKK